MQYGDWESGSHWWPCDMIFLVGPVLWNVLACSKHHSSNLTSGPCPKKDAMVFSYLVCGWLLRVNLIPVHILIASCHFIEWWYLVSAELKLDTFSLWKVFDTKDIVSEKWPLIEMPTSLKTFLERAGVISFREDNEIIIFYLLYMLGTKWPDRLITLNIK